MVWLEIWWAFSQILWCTICQIHFKTLTAPECMATERKTVPEICVASNCFPWLSSTLAPRMIWRQRPKINSTRKLCKKNRGKTTQMISLKIQESESPTCNLTGDSSVEGDLKGWSQTGTSDTKKWSARISHYKSKHEYLWTITFMWNACIYSLGSLGYQFPSRSFQWYICHWRIDGQFPAVVQQQYHDDLKGIPAHGRSILAHWNTSGKSWNPLLPSELC